MCMTWLIHVCDRTQSYLWQDSFICVTGLIRMCDMTHWYLWQDSFIFVTGLIHMCDGTYSCVWHDSLIFVTGLIRMWKITHSYAWLDSFVWQDWRLEWLLEWLLYNVWNNSFIHVTGLWMSHGTRTNKSRYTYVQGVYVWHDSLRDATHSCAWHDSSLKIHIFMCTYTSI